MKDWRSVLCPLDATIREGIRVIDQSGMQIGLIVDAEERLRGIVTDGDVRRGILKGIPLDASIQEIMNPNPTTIGTDDVDEAVLEIMLSKTLHHLPIVDDGGVLRGLRLLDHLVNRQVYENIVVLMAGGLGSRLGELTKETPKPLLPVGNKPILETIIRNLHRHGFRRFYISINYLASKVRDYFGDGSRFGVQIHYLEEEKRMGTAGALSLLSEETKLPLLVMNGDLLTQINFHHLMDFHADQQAEATLCVREFSFQVPYGVVRIDGSAVMGIEEKPHKTCFVSAGIYALSPHLLQEIPKHTHYDMPELFNAILARNGRVAAFPISEYWLDVGHIHDFHRANGDFGVVFEGH